MLFIPKGFSSLDLKLREFTCDSWALPAELWTSCSVSYCMAENFTRGISYTEQRTCVEKGPNRSLGDWLNYVGWIFKGCSTFLHIFPSQCLKCKPPSPACTVHIHVHKHACVLLVAVLSKKLVFSIPEKLGESKIQHCNQKKGKNCFQQGQKTHMCPAFSSLQTRFIVAKSDGIYTFCH